MFRGISAINMDAKGRLAVPARYRTLLHDTYDSQLVATIDTEESCLLIYPTSEWEMIQEKIESLPSFNQTARRIQRLLIGYATDLEMDGNGRVLFPNLLREYAGLQKKVMLIGQGKKFELWDETQWNERRDAWLQEDLKQGLELPTELQSLSL